jgi:hypothetical protein
MTSFFFRYSFSIDFLKYFTIALIITYFPGPSLYSIRYSTANKEGGSASLSRSVGSLKKKGREFVLLRD